MFLEMFTKGGRLVEEEGWRLCVAVEEEDAEWRGRICMS